MAVNERTTRHDHADDAVGNLSTLVETLNRYSHVTNNPCTWVDPSGLDPSVHDSGESLGCNAVEFGFGAGQFAGGLTLEVASAYASIQFAGTLTPWTAVGLFSGMAKHVERVGDHVGGLHFGRSVPLMSAFEAAAFVGVLVITLTIAGLSRYLVARRSGRPMIDVVRYLVGLGALLAIGLLIFILVTKSVGSRPPVAIVLLIGAATTAYLAVLLPRRPWRGDVARRATFVRVLWIMSLAQLLAAIALGVPLITGR